MTVLTRWEPFRDLSALQNRMNRLFEAQYGGGREESLTAGAFVPAVDVYEDEHSIQLKLEVPGIDEKDLDIKVENNVLSVSGERKLEKEEKGTSTAWSAVTAALLARSACRTRSRPTTSRLTTITAC